MFLYLQLIFSYYFRNYKSSEIVLTRSSRGSHILKTLVKEKAEIMDTNQKRTSENEEVISPKVRVGLAEKGKHSVSVQNALKSFITHRIRMSLNFLYFSRLYSY